MSQRTASTALSSCGSTPVPPVSEVFDPKDWTKSIDADQVVLQYYPPRQYARFTPAARTKLKALREAAKAEKRKGKKGSNDGRSKKRQRTASVSSDPTSDDESSVESDASGTAL